MEAEIDILTEKKPGGWKFEVKVRDEYGKSHHFIKLDKSYYEKLTNKQVSPEKLIDETMRFLLRRKDKEQISKSFSLTIISRIHPEYENYLKTRF